MYYYLLFQCNKYIFEVEVEIITLIIYFITLIVVQCGYEYNVEAVED